MSMRVVVGMSSAPSQLVLYTLRDGGACGVKGGCYRAPGGHVTSARAQAAISTAGIVRAYRGMHDVHVEGCKAVCDIHFRQ